MTNSREISPVKISGPLRGSLVCFVYLVYLVYLVKGEGLSGLSRLFGLFRQAAARQ
jgi:hypothetical protein